MVSKHLERFRVIFTEERANNNAQKPQQELYPLHLLLSKLDPTVIDQLPAGHAPTSCDTVAKVGTKEKLLHILNSFDPLITGFGREALDDDILQQAEQFLINEVTKMYRSYSTFDELRTKLYHHQSNKKDLLIFLDLRWLFIIISEERSCRQSCG